MSSLRFPLSQLEKQKVSEAACFFRERKEIAENIVSHNCFVEPCCLLELVFFPIIFCSFPENGIRI